MRIHKPPLAHSPVPLLVGAAAVLAVAALAVCTRTRTPSGVKAVTGFHLPRYTGYWYEVARIDNVYERGLSHATAHYSDNGDGTVTVVNRGYDAAREKWKQVVGKARFTGRSDEAALKVSFFGPFYGGYNVVALDDDYQWAMVVGESFDYVWILSRTPQLPRGVREHLLERAMAMGIDTERLCFTESA